MQSISHHALTVLIKTALEKRNIKLETAAYFARIDPRALARCIGGIAPYTPEILAPLGKYLHIDYGRIYAQYAFGRYAETLARLNSPEREPEKKRGQHGSDELSPLASSIVASNPNTPTQLLIQHLMDSVPGLFEPIAASAIKKAQNSSQRTGDYDAA